MGGEMCFDAIQKKLYARKKTAMMGIHIIFRDIRVTLPVRVNWEEDGQSSPILAVNEKGGELY